MLAADRSLANEKTPPSVDGVKFGRKRHNRQRAARWIMPRFADHTPIYVSESAPGATNPAKILAFESETGQQPQP